MDTSSILGLVESTSDFIHEECQKWDFENPPFDLAEFIDSLAHVMLKENGIGISANQVGKPYQIFLVAGGAGPKTVKAFINSEIVDSSKEKIMLEEGCLTYPGISINIRRPRTIRIRYTEPNGETRTDTYTGITARVIQHEYDHGQGLTMFDKASVVQRDKAKKKWKKIQSQS